MGVEDKLPPLNIPKPSKCGNSPSTASNSTCPSSSRKFDYYGPWTLSSRIPIPPNSSIGLTESIFPRPCLSK